MYCLKYGATIVKTGCVHPGSLRHHDGDMFSGIISDTVSAMVRLAITTDSNIIPAGPK